MKTITVASPSAIFLCGCRQLFAHHSKYNLLNTVAIETLSDALDISPTDAVVVDGSAFTVEKGIFTEGGIFLEKAIQNHPKIKFLTLIRSEKSNFAANTEGGNWLVPHTLTEAELLTALDNLFNTGCCAHVVSTVSPTIAKTFDPAEEPLTKREKQVLDLIVNGLTSKKIAQKLYISDRTVEVHRTNLCRKLHVANTASLVRTAIQMPHRS
jgi:DNA-binding NarL/FixJ family response regulator